jgi:hypothetical protein
LLRHSAKSGPSLHLRNVRATPHGGGPPSCCGGFRFAGHVHAGKPEELDEEVALAVPDEAEVEPPVAEDSVKAFPVPVLVLEQARSAARNGARNIGSTRIL